MDRVKDVSQKSANSSNEISLAIEGQAQEVQNILTNMEVVKNGMNCLADVLNGKQ
ncbi:MAG: hypothetical protein ACI4HI_17005 [Lachnospiraceae bacterium]